MTAQWADRIRYKGQEFDLWDEPLNQFLSIQRPRPKFEFANTALWKGYLARWEIAADHLLLLSVSGRLQGGGEVLQTLFPGRRYPIRADWYTGSLCVPCGKTTTRRGWVYGVEYDDHKLVRVEQGTVVGVEEGLGRVPSFSAARGQ